jgi:hypothetical protein
MTILFLLFLLPLPAVVLAWSWGLKARNAMVVQPEYHHKAISPHIILLDDAILQYGASDHYSAQLASQQGFLMLSTMKLT